MHRVRQATLTTRLRRLIPNSHPRWACILAMYERPVSKGKREIDAAGLCHLGCSRREPEVRLWSSESAGEDGQGRCETWIWILGMRLWKLQILLHGPEGSIDWQWRSEAAGCAAIYSLDGLCECQVGGIMMVFGVWHMYYSSMINEACIPRHIDSPILSMSETC